MSLAIVQTATNWEIRPGSGPTVTFATAPTAGNLMIIFATSFQSPNGKNGWTLLEGSSPGSNNTPFIWYKYAGVSEPAAQNFCDDTFRDILSFGYEISGVAGTVGSDIQAHAITADKSITTTSQTGTSITTTATGLFLAFGCGKWGAGETVTGDYPSTDGTDDNHNDTMSATGVGGQYPGTISHKQYTGSGQTAQLTYTYPSVPDQNFAEYAGVVINGALSGGGNSATVTTSLGGISQELDATVSSPAGITTRLSGISQVLMAAEANQAVVTTHLTGIGQTLIAHRISAPGTGRRVYWTS